MHFRSLKKSAGEVSLSDSIDSDGDGGGLSLMDMISVDDDMLESISSAEMYSKLRRFISEVLTEREQQIIQLRYGIGMSHQKTQREIAAMCGISRSYVSRIEKKAIEKLKAAFDEDDTAKPVSAKKRRKP